MTFHGMNPSQLQIRLGLASALSYASGYPLAIAGGYVIGWALVALGGVLLLALGIVTVRRIHTASDT